MKKERKNKRGLDMRRENKENKPREEKGRGEEMTRKERRRKKR